MASDIGLDAAAWQFDEQQRLVITERSGRESAGASSAAAGSSAAGASSVGVVMVPAGCV